MVEFRSSRSLQNTPPAVPLRSHPQANLCRKTRCQQLRKPSFCSAHMSQSPSDHQRAPPQVQEPGQKYEV
eukprot:3162393-Pyramimonas_sp.AAC.1